ncbi:hypothetical protein K1719_019909 [Acacia pycnantha]|nr:hypothetical protein K1719_019909 [Acacia pycnantha]
MRGSPKKRAMPFAKWFSYLDWRWLLFITSPLFLFFLFFSPSPSPSFSSFSSLPHFIISHAFQDNSTFNNGDFASRDESVVRSRIAVCLVGGARRFELTGPSIIDNILKQYPNSDLFLHSPLDKGTFKFSLLKNAPRVASVRIFQPQPLPETESEARVLTALHSPNALQGLIQYFNLVEGCLTMIKSYEAKKNFKYDWIVRTRVDGYWNRPLEPEHFTSGEYVVPEGSSYGGLNDRLGIGDQNTSKVALSRLSLIPALDSAGFHGLNSETAFKAQLTTQGVSYVTKRLPFCIVSDRRYDFPPGEFGVPVAALSSPGPLSGAKCRPCRAACKGKCVDRAMAVLNRGWSWTRWGHGSLRLCNASAGWEDGWETLFDKGAGKKFAAARKRIQTMKLEDCLRDFKQLKKRAVTWNAPPATDICTLGLAHT